MRERTAIRVAQASGASRQKAGPTGSSATDRHRRSTAPPGRRPPRTRRCTRSARRGSRSPRRTRQGRRPRSASCAMSSAAIPRARSARRSTKPIPPPSRSAPTMALSRTSRASGHERTRPPARPTTSAGSARRAGNGVAAMRNGGIESTATGSRGTSTPRRRRGRASRARSERRRWRSVTPDWTYRLVQVSRSIRDAVNAQSGPAASAARVRPADPARAIARLDAGRRRSGTRCRWAGR